MFTSFGNTNSKTAYVARGFTVSFHYNLYINMDNDHLYGASSKKKNRAILSHWEISADTRNL